MFKKGENPFAKGGKGDDTDEGSSRHEKKRKKMGRKKRGRG